MERHHDKMSPTSLPFFLSDYGEKYLAMVDRSSGTRVTTLNCLGNVMENSVEQQGARRKHLRQGKTNMKRNLFGLAIFPYFTDQNKIDTGILTTKLSRLLGI